jgi:hypothetical protein
MNYDLTRVGVFINRALKLGQLSLPHDFCEEATIDSRLFHRNQIFLAPTSLRFSGCEAE